MDSAAAVESRYFGRFSSFTRHCSSSAKCNSSHLNPNTRTETHISGPRVASDAERKRRSNISTCAVTSFIPTHAVFSPSGKQMQRKASARHTEHRLTQVNVQLRQVLRLFSFFFLLVSLTSSWLVELESSPGKGM